MIKRVIPLAALVFSSSVIAQVGIGTQKPATSAQLDIVATDKGVLLPRVQLNTINDHSVIKGKIEESLLVYHVGTSTLEAGFYYWKSNVWNRLLSGDVVTDRKNNTFTIGANPNQNGEESLIITDTQNAKVYLAVSEIAKNTSFVTELASNNEFATQLGDNTTFIEQVTSNTAFIQNLISELEGTYGTVNYDVEQQVFYYMEGNTRRDITLEDLNTENQSFTLENDHLVITDSEGSQVRVAVSEIAKNTSFVTELASNNEFVTKLGDNNKFQDIVKDNSLVAELKVSETVENSETVKGRFQFTNGKSEPIHFSETLTAMEKGVDESGKTEYYFIDETGERDPVIVKVTQDIITDFNIIMEDEKVKELMIGLIQANSGKGDASVHKNEEGDILITNAQASYNLSKEISNKETNTSLTLLGKGVYVYKNEEAIKTEGEGVTINVIEDVQNNFQEIMNNADVKTILNEFLTQGLAGNVTYKNGDFYVTYEKDQAFVTEKLELKSWIEKEASALTTDGVIAVEVDGVVGEAAEKAVLKAMKLSINEDAITTEHIKDGTIQPMDLAEAGKNQVLITGADQKPIWKDQNKVAPQFFYMPAVIFDTSIAGTTTRDLYQEYVNQFTGGSKNSENPVAYPISHGPAGTTPLLYGGGIVGSAGAPADIAVFESHELYYYVTYYDESVFENLSISADGKLTYTVKGGATPSSYMNIVFVIK